MKKIQLFISLFILAFLFGCSNDTSDINIDDINAPVDISALMTIKQDNSGKVTFIPRGEGVSQYEIFYGDGTVDPGYVSPGATILHIYAEGVYQVKIVGTTLNGKRTEVIQVLTVSFLAPTDFVATIAHVPGDNMSITVQATANLETFFQVYFGETPGETPVEKSQVIIFLIYIENLFD